MQFELEKDEARFRSKFDGAVGLLYINLSSLGAVAVTRGTTGVLLQRDDKSKAWGDPKALRFGGVGFGVEAGIQNTEAVFCFDSTDALDRFLQTTSQGKLWSFKGSFTLGPFGYTRETMMQRRNKYRQHGLSTLYCHSTGLNVGMSFMLSGLELDSTKTQTFCSSDAVEFSAKLATLMSDTSCAS